MKTAGDVIAEKHRKRERITKKLAVMAVRGTDNERAVAQSMLDKRRSGPEGLVGIADQIRVESGKGIETQFAIGRLLLEARDLMPGDHDFSAWLDRENFSFGKKTAYYLRLGAQREAEVRGYIAARSEGSRDIGVTSVIYYMLNAERAPKITDPAPTVSEQAVRDNTGFVTLRAGIHQLLGWEVDDETGIGGPTANGLVYLPEDQLHELKVLVEAIAKAFGQARKAAA